MHCLSIQRPRMANNFFPSTHHYRISKRLVYYKMSDNNNSSSDQSQQQQGSLFDAASKAASVLGGHAQLAQGATQEQIGNLLNSDEWKQSGIDLKGDAGENIKKAYEDFKSQGGSDQDLISKVSSYADKACPETGDGIGSNQQGN